MSSSAPKLSSSQKITTFLWFDHNQAQAAAEFYISVFSSGPVPSDDCRVVTSSPVVTTFTLAGVSFCALNGGPQFKFTPAVSLLIDCQDQDEVDHFWAEFAKDGGRPGRCGWIEDKFGLSWQVVPKALPELLGSDDEEGAGRAMKAMMGMDKLEVEGLRKAFDGAA